MSGDVLTETAGGLFGCFGDGGNCIFTCLCSPCAYGSAMSSAGENCLLCGLSLCCPISPCLTAYFANEKNKEYGGSDQLWGYICKSCCPFTACCQMCVYTKGIKECAAKMGPTRQTME
mmetsp:Transcript_10174/g.14805  ORF Transcript_10174/g.14805 Transcript_10174/m.14805 type:complete len:118 (+) Transcript_10174:28-381(+)|eukprot:CAMPEP_0175099830 /NCGR_PEP_ID=MMETSP0086_2-20121207/6690_1 /TAXON_ID=136419 /ORGANISM="Unknown Unknown, Strain D1" /LENGTH=117 /DNA_ID=CAMNT_0016373755 /DNA_START=28 /DNA_END=381 /DNA_ORIENTATION=+